MLVRTVRWCCVAYSDGSQSHHQCVGDGRAGVAVPAQSLHHHLQTGAQRPQCVHDDARRSLSHRQGCRSQSPTFLLNVGGKLRQVSDLVYRRCTATPKACLWSYAAAFCPRHISRKIKLEGVRKEWGCGTLKPEGPNIEAQRANSGGWGFGGGGSQLLSPPRGSGERCELPQRGLGQSSNRHMVCIDSEYFRYCSVGVWSFDRRGCGPKIGRVLWGARGEEISLSVHVSCLVPLQSVIVIRLPSTATLTLSVQRFRGLPGSVRFHFINLRGTSTILQHTFDSKFSSSEFISQAVFACDTSDHAEYFQF